jgi:hypothetical protein
MIQARKLPRSQKIAGIGAAHALQLASVRTAFAAKFERIHDACWMRIDITRGSKDRPAVCVGAIRTCDLGVQLHV